MGGMIRVLVVDDHPATSAGVSAAIAAESGMGLVGVATTLGQARELIEDLHPDVLLCDIQLGEERALELPRHLGSPTPAVLFFTGYDYPSYVRAALDSGAAGFLLKSVPLPEVVSAIRTVAAGGSVFGARDLRRAQHVPRIPSAREIEVIALVAAGRSNAEVAVALGLDERTIESHLRRLFLRYGVGSRTELVMEAVRAGWINTPG